MTFHSWAINGAAKGETASAAATSQDKMVAERMGDMA